MAASSFKTLDDADLNGKRVLVRVDLNVPMKDGEVTDATRLQRIVPTLSEISEKGGKVIILAHFGRPKGEKVAEMSLKPVVPALAKVLDRPVMFAEDCIGDIAKGAIDAMSSGDILVLENTRYYKGEEKNEAEFVSALAENGDLLVSDAFSVSHRAHATTEGLANHMPAVAGRTMQAELEALDAALGTPKRPVLAIVGGAKVSTKIDLLENLVSKVDGLVIGGGMANTFLAAQGKDVGKSLCEHDLADTAKRIMAAAEKADCEIILPVDAAVAKEFAANAPHKIVDVDSVPSDSMMLDVGPKSVEAVASWIKKAQTIVWNGPLGAFEIAPFDTATVAAAQAAAEETKADNLISVAGGGDTVAALNHAGVSETFSYVSTAGGAFLEWMEGKALPGVEVLKN
ncbi:phosphoglycerate kinase [Cohaesibacter gelatinilyticus]|uniref:Phosphoglycerate kinase n=1 Tax=Cohaesibacter gelatinilyticus TaxID=372072 RepID=A0A285PHC2_9HYPH|nr:phosphoglycerate kinase [Cohaesibacter gelatinilyticus]SNZ21114.1 phosphoglycerate kinase [Cohaesibacter gelatinilyticus]